MHSSVLIVQKDHSFSRCCNNQLPPEAQVPGDNTISGVIAVDFKLDLNIFKTYLRAIHENIGQTGKYNQFICGDTILRQSLWPYNKKLPWTVFYWRRGKPPTPTSFCDQMTCANN